MFFSSCLLGIVISVAAVQNDIPDVSDVEDRVLAPRRSLVRGELEAHTVYRQIGEDGKEQLRCVREHRCAFDGKKVRWDCKDMEDTQEAPPKIQLQKIETYVPTPNLRVTRAFNGNTFFSWEDPGQSNLGTFYVAIKYPKNLQPLDYRLDPRNVGLVPGSFEDAGTTYKMTSFVGNRDRKGLQIQGVSLNSLDCWKVAYDFLDGQQHISYWVSPKQGYSVVRIEYEWYLMEDGKKARYVDCQQSEVKEYESSGIFFPSTFVYQRHIDDRLREEQAGEVTRIKFNQPVSADTFSLAGMNIPPGTPVMDYTGHYQGKCVWDGKEVIASQRNPFDAPSSNNRWWIISANLALLGILTFWLFIRRRRRRLAA